MRLGTWLQHVDLRHNASLVEQWLYGNRSILSGLRRRVPRRARGQAARRLPRSAPVTSSRPRWRSGMAVGRVGCLLTELPGTPTGLPWGVTLDAGAAERLGAPGRRAAAPLVRVRDRLSAVAFAVLWSWLRHRLTAPGSGSRSTWPATASSGSWSSSCAATRSSGGLTRPQLFLLARAPLAPGAHRLAGRAGVYAGPVAAAERPTALTSQPSHSPPLGPHPGQRAPAAATRRRRSAATPAGPGRARSASRSAPWQPFVRSPWASAGLRAASSFDVDRPPP